MASRVMGGTASFYDAMDSVAERTFDPSTGEQVLFVDSMVASTLLGIVKLIERLRKHSGPLYEWKEYRKGYPFFGIVPNRLGYELIGYADGYLVDLKRKLFLRKLHPSVELLYEKLVEHRIFSDMRNFQSGDKEIVLKVFERINAFADDLRKSIRSKVFKTSLESFYRTSSNNFRSIVDFYSKIMGSHSRVLSVRVDLSYRGGAIRSMPDLNDELLVLNDRDRFIHHLRKTFSSGLLGYVWKIEYGCQKGFHIHFHALFNGSLHQQDVLIGKVLGEYWSSEITQGIGIYRNCNARKNDYHFLALGSLSRSNVHALKGLGMIARYFSKADLLARVALAGSHRSMGKSAIRVQEGKRGPKPVVIPFEKFIV